MENKKIYVVYHKNGDFKSGVVIYAENELMAKKTYKEITKIKGFKTCSIKDLKAKEIF